MIDYRRYPPNWLSEIRPRILARAKHRCECMGECGLHPWWRCQEIHGRKARFARGRVVLTIAHMDSPESLFGHIHTPENPYATVLAMCQKCHLRYDGHRHLAASQKAREARAAIWREALEQAGQLRIL